MNTKVRYLVACAANVVPFLVGCCFYRYIWGVIGFCFVMAFALAIANFCITKKVLPYLGLNALAFASLAFCTVTSLDLYSYRFFEMLQADWEELGYAAVPAVLILFFVLTFIFAVARATYHQCAAARAKRK